MGRCRKEASPTDEVQQSPGAEGRLCLPLSIRDAREMNKNSSYSGTQLWLVGVFFLLNILLIEHGIYVLNS